MPKLYIKYVCYFRKYYTLRIVHTQDNCRPQLDDAGGCASSFSSLSGPSGFTFTETLPPLHVSLLSFETPPPPFSPL